MSKISKMQILITMKFQTLKVQNFIAAKLNEFTVMFSLHIPFELFFSSACTNFNLDMLA